MKFKNLLVLIASVSLFSSVGAAGTSAPFNNTETELDTSSKITPTQEELAEWNKEYTEDEKKQAVQAYHKKLKKQGNKREKLINWTPERRAEVFRFLQNEHRQAQVTLDQEQPATLAEQNITSKKQDDEKETKQAQVIPAQKQPATKRILKNKRKSGNKINFLKFILTAVSIYFSTQKLNTPCDSISQCCPINPSLCNPESQTCFVHFFNNNSLTSPICCDQIYFNESLPLPDQTSTFSNQMSDQILTFSDQTLKEKFHQDASKLEKEWEFAEYLKNQEAAQKQIQLNQQVAKEQPSSSGYLDNILNYFK